MTSPFAPSWQDLAEMPESWEDKLRRIVGTIAPMLDMPSVQPFPCKDCQKMMRGPVCPWCGTAQVPPEEV